MPSYYDIYIPDITSKLDIDNLIIDIMELLHNVDECLKPIIKTIMLIIDEISSINLPLLSTKSPNAPRVNLRNMLSRAPPKISLNNKIETLFFLHKEELQKLGKSLFWYLFSSKCWDILHIIFNF